MNDGKIIKETSLFKRKSKLIIMASLLTAAAVVCIFFIVRHFNNKNDENKAYVASVAELTGYGSLGVAGRFTGVVESQKAITVNSDSSKTIKTCFVKVGDQVTAGTQLFEYDTNEINLSIEELQLEIDKLNIEINSARQQIAQLESEKASAPADEQLSYTMQIQSLNTDIASNQYDVNSKQAELDKHKASLANAIVTSTADGIIKSIGESSSEDNSDMMGSANETPYISILPLGDYQIKGTLTELNMGDMAEGSNVIIRSRVDSSKSVKGTVSKIDYNNPISSSSSSDIDIDSGSSSGESASKWYFYVTFENTGDLILGQHVFIEPDYGQDDSKEGLWLSELYLGKNDDGSYFAWKEKKGKLIKQNLELGEYNSENMEYKILKGLTTDDYIAFPSDELFEGQTVTHSAEAAGDINPDDIDIDGDIDLDDVDIDGDIDLDNIDGDGDADLDSIDGDDDNDSDNEDNDNGDNDDEPDTSEEDGEEDSEE